MFPFQFYQRIVTEFFAGNAVLCLEVI